MDDPQHRNRARARLLLALACCGAGQALAHGSAHEHGVARLEIAVEDRRISVHLESPLDNLVGFERAPRTDAERRRVADALRQFETRASLIRVDPAGHCTLRKVDLQSAALALGPKQPEDPDGHADLDADFDFDCAAGARAAYLEVGMFTAFPRLQRIEVQAVTPTAQRQATLHRPEQRVRLAP